jgi:hypothetical protein
LADPRPLEPTDRPFLEEMLFEAFFWNHAWPRPTLADFRAEPEFMKLLADWGRPGDRGVLAEERPMVSWTPTRPSWASSWTLLRRLDRAEDGP